MVIIMTIIHIYDGFLEFQEFNQNGVINKTKDRRLFLTNDIVICVSVVPKNGDDFSSHSERLYLKWAYPVSDVEVSSTYLIFATFFIPINKYYW